MRARMDGSPSWC